MKSDREKVLNSFSPLCLVKKMHLIIKNCTKKLFIHRENYSSNSYIWDGVNLFWDRLVSQELFTYQDLLNKKSVHYSSDEDMNLSFGDVMLGKKLTSKNLKECPGSFTQYFLLNSIVTSPKVRSYRFEPLSKTEHILIMKTSLELNVKIAMPMSGFDIPNFAMNRKLMNNCNILQMLNTNYQRNTEMEEKATSTTTMNDLSMLVNTFKGEINRTTLDLYLKSRHNVWAGAVMEVADWEGSLDQNIGEKFDYDGPDCNKTPDLILEQEDTAYLLDFAVTNSSVGMVSSSKIEKYTEVCKALEKKFQKKFEVVPLVLSLGSDTQMSSHSLYNSYKPILTNTMESLNQLDSKVRLLKGYDESYRIFLEMNKMGGGTNDLNELCLDMLNEMLDNTTLDQKKAVDIKDSYTKDSSDINMKFMVNKNDKMVKGVLKDWENFDEKREFNKLHLCLSNKVKDNEVPESLEAFFNTENLDEVIKQEMCKMEELRQQYNRNKENQVSSKKIFKLPDLCEIEKAEAMTSLSYRCKNIELSDGTVVYFMKHRIEEEEKEWVRMGLGINMEEDLSVLDTLLSWLSSFKDGYRELPSNMLHKDHVKQFNMTNGVQLCKNISHLMDNLVKLEGRRMALKKPKAQTVFKEYENYSLEVNAGSRLTKESQIRYRVWLSEKNFEDNNMFYNFTWDEEMCGYRTRWLTISSLDLKHYHMLYERALSTLVHLADNYLEDKSDEEEVNYSSKIFYGPLAVLLEHRRGTSTTLQYNRYIFHSVTGFLSDRKGTVRGISSDPVRSRFEAMMKCLQFNWCLEMSKGIGKKWVKQILNAVRTHSDYDRFCFPSFFDPNILVEFSFTMNELYYCNMFQKESGFSLARSKAIMLKMIKEEMLYLVTRELESSRGNQSFESMAQSSDMHHTYCKEFVMLMSSRLSRKLIKQGDFYTKLLLKMMKGVQETMMMTSSLKAFPTLNMTIPIKADKENDTVFNAMLTEMIKHGTSWLLKLADQDDYVEALFSLFPKSQIGGPREILIQSFMLRKHVKLMERVAEVMCELHEKEMLTKGKKKEEKQSSAAKMFKDKMRDVIRNKRGACLMPSLNADASRWAPSMVMNLYLHFLGGLPIPDKLKQHMMTVVRSFSRKLMVIPNSLQKSWKKEEFNREEVPEINWLKNNTMNNNWVVQIFSGMGQGMLHKMSSILHCAKDDLMDEVVDIVMKEFNVEIRSLTLISSDDSTKQMFFKSDSVERCFWAMKAFSYIYDTTSRMANMHTNLKKTALQFFITEFNSYFSTGKRACLATIKDVYTAMEMPDSTCPETAVKEVISNISRAYKNGCYLNTCEVMLILMRNWLLKCYYLSTDIVEQLKSLLDCKEEYLPLHLGFVPLRHTHFVLLTGADCLMFDSQNSEALNSFYKGMYTAKGYKQGIHEYLGSEQCSFGKLWLRLPFRTDKRMREMIESFHQEMDISKEKTIRMMEKHSLLTEKNQLDCFNIFKFVYEYYIGMSKNYEFGVVKSLHSVIRAMQYSNQMLTISGLEEEEDTDGFPLEHNLMKPMKEIKGKMSTEEVVITMIKRGERFKNNLLMLDKERKEMGIAERLLEFFPQMKKTNSARHSKKRVHSCMMDRNIVRCTLDEFLNRMMDPDSYKNKRVDLMMMNLKEMLNLQNNEEGLSFKVMMSVFSEFLAPHHAMKNYLSKWISHNLYTKLEVMTTFPDSGDFLENILNLYCERKNPRCIYSINLKLGDMSMEKNMSTTMSMGGSFGDFIIGEKETEELSSNNILTHFDSHVVKFAKMVKITHSSKKLSQEVISCDKIYYRMFWDNNNRYYAYSDLKNLLILKIETNKGVVRGNVIENSRSLKDMLEYLMMDAQNNFIEKENVKFYNNSKEVSHLDLKMNNLRVLLKVNKMKTYWEGMMQVQNIRFKGMRKSEVNFSICTKEYCIYTRHMRSSELAEDMTKLKNRSLSLKELDSLLDNMNLKEAMSSKFNKLVMKAEPTWKREKSSILGSSTKSMDFSYLEGQSWAEEELLDWEEQEVEDDDDTTEISMNQMMDSFFSSMQSCGFNLLLNNISKEMEIEEPLYDDMSFDLSFLNDELMNFEYTEEVVDEPLHSQLHIVEMVSNQIALSCEKIINVNMMELKRVISRTNKQENINLIWSLFCSKLTKDLMEKLKISEWLAMSCFLVTYFNLTSVHQAKKADSIIMMSRNIETNMRGDMELVKLDSSDAMMANITDFAKMMRKGKKTRRIKFNMLNEDMDSDFEKDKSKRKSKNKRMQRKKF
jgi:hypothetical protein